MINFKTISLSNFWSFGKKPTVIDLDGHNTTTLILGKNADKEDTANSSNGSGKSGVMLGIVYAIYGEGFDKLKQDEFINLTNGKEMYIEFNFQKNEREYKIIRGRKPNVLEFYRDGEDITLDSAKNTQDLIESVIEMDRQIFMNTYYLSPDNDPFLAMKPSEQTSFMERVLSLDTLRERANSLKESKKEYKQELAKLNSLEEKRQEINNRIDNDIIELKKNYSEFERKREQEIEEAKAKLDSLKQVDSKTINNQLDRASELDIEINNHKKDIEYMSSKVNEKKENINSLVNKKNKAENLIEEHEFHNSKRLQEYEDALSEKEELSNYDIENIEKTLIRVSKIDDILVDKRQTYEENTKFAEQSLNQIDEKKAELETLSSGVCPYCSQSHYDSDKVNELETIINNTIDNLESVEHTINSIEYEINELEAEKQSINPELSRDELEHIKKRLDELDKIIEDKSGEDESRIPLIDEILSMFGGKEPDDVIEIGSKELDELEKELQTLNENKRIYEQELSSINTKGFDKESINAIEEQINELENKITITKEKNNKYESQIEYLKTTYDTVDYQSSIDYYNKELQHCEVLINLLIDNKSYVRKNIVDNYIPYINTKVNQYLNELNSSHYIELNSDLTVDIQYMMRSVSYHNGSKGEKLRLNLAMSLAFRDMLAMLGHKSNLMCVDEFLDAGGDRAGYLQMFKLLKGYTDHVMIVTHREELQDKVDNVMTVCKQNGFSSVKEE